MLKFKREFRCLKVKQINTIFYSEERHIATFYIYLYGANLRERDHWGDPDVDGRIILRWIFRKWDGVVGTGWSWLRIGTGGGRMWVR